MPMMLTSNYAMLDGMLKTPDFCEYDDDGRGCYSYCKAGERGSFPVWVVEFAKLEVERNGVSIPYR